MAAFDVARKSVLWLLSISLALTILRQICDFIGRLWAPIVINFVHILFLIFGYFGLLQKRPGYLILSAFWLPLALTWNVFLACYYLSLPPLNRTVPLLSFGEKLSRSFWQQYIPFCQASYDYASEQWITPQGCTVYYWHIEMVQAGNWTLFLCERTILLHSLLQGCTF